MGYSFVTADSESYSQILRWQRMENLKLIPVKLMGNNISYLKI